MGMLDHWQPAIPSKSLRKKPIGIQIAGRPIALFRTESGKIGAVDDSCVHRRMKLSYGWVAGEKLMCRYHGWTFDCDGQAESPGTPKMHACTAAYDIAEAYGFIWVKPKNVVATFPKLDVEGWYYMSYLERTMAAPLELTLDNFCEIEHTATTHRTFGYPLDAMKDVKVEYQTTDETVRVINTGPAMSLGPIMNTLVGIKTHYHFYDDWTTYFSPVYSVYDHYWIDPNTTKESKVKWKIAIFFTPIDDQHTRLTAFSFGKSRWPGPMGGLRLFKWLMKRELAREIDADISMIKMLANYDPKLEGMKLSRFDRALGLNRERIQRIYRGTNSLSLV